MAGYAAHMRVAVLGTGTMGRPMAENLARAGHDVVVWNRTRARAEQVAGVRVADTPVDAVRGADAVITMLTDGNAVEDAVRDVDALPLWMQMSTVGVDATARLIDVAQTKGATFVDAPVSGTKQPAEDGKLIVLASGPEAVRAQCDELFAPLAQHVLWVGDAGAGTRMKLVVNNWLLAFVSGLAETIALSQALGLDPQLFLDAVAGGALDAPYVQLRGLEMAAESFPPSFAVRLAHKDAGLVLEAAAQAGLTLPVAQAVEGELEQAVELGHGDDDVAAVYEAVKPRSS